MTDAPEQLIRRYLDEHGGETNATVDHLLTTFGIDEADHSGRDKIREALSQAGVGISRPLHFLSRNEEIRLFTEDSGGSEAAAPGGLEESADVGDPLEGREEVSASGVPQREAAWYPDSNAPGQLRWWDGNKWTEHVHPEQQTAPYSPRSPAPSSQQRPQAQATQGSAGSKQLWYKRPWVIVVGGIIVIAIIASASSSSDDKGGGGSPAEKTSGGNSKASGDSGSSKPASTKATDDNTPHVGPSGHVTVDGLVYSIPSARTASTLGDPSIGTDAKAAGVFVVLKVRVHSTKGETVTLTDDTIKLEAKNKSVYSADTEGSTAALLSAGNASAKPFFLEDIQPDTTTTGTIVFDVPRRVLDTGPEVRFNELGFSPPHGYIRLPSL